MSRCTFTYSLLSTGNVAQLNTCTETHKSWLHVGSGRAERNVKNLLARTQHDPNKDQRNLILQILAISLTPFPLPRHTHIQIFGGVCGINIHICVCFFCLFRHQIFLVFNSFFNSDIFCSFQIATAAQKNASLQITANSVTVT